MAAQESIVPGSVGFTREVHKRRGVEQINGYAATDGALGFDGYGWGVLARQDTDEALEAASNLQSTVFTVVVVAGPDRRRPGLLVGSECVSADPAGDRTSTGDRSR